MSRGGLRRRELLLFTRARAPAHTADAGRGNRSQTTDPTPRPGPPLPAILSWLEPTTKPEAEALECSPGVARPRPAPLRPPGAIAEPAFLERCTRCGDCMRACPHAAIEAAPARFAAARATPWIDPYRAPCRLCEDFPCVTACETGALDLAQAGPIGTAIVRKLDCLNEHGTTCTVCAEHCPVPDAIQLTQAAPRIEPALCTGCGACAYVCPAPNRAILVLPAQRA